MKKNSHSNSILDQLAIKHGTDKSSTEHSYTHLYDATFAQLRHWPIRLLEIGVEEGRSLRMWEDYFPKARIFGIDIRQDCRRFQTERTRIFIGDQSDHAFLERVVSEAGGYFDIIIDDGGHWMHEQITSLQTLWPFLSPMGIYVIEDLHTSYIPEYGGGFRKYDTTVEFLKQLVDDVHLQGQPSHLVRDIASIHFYRNICFLFKCNKEQIQNLAANRKQSKK